MSLQILETAAAVREFVKSQKANGRSVGLVPTMGALHEGHLELGRTARKECDSVIYSIFVNPTQFGPHEDLDKYPRTFTEDCRKLESIGIDAVYAPSNLEMYPAGYKSYVTVEELGEKLCGKTRTNHFRGVTTVVLKLFNIVQCDKAYFGLKDYQQLAIIRTMVKDLNVPVELIGVPIVREADGLAMSSRNVYLSPAERSQATVLSRALFQVREQFKRFNSPQELISAAKEIISAAPLAEIEYVELKNADTLADPVSLHEPLVLLLAVRFGKTRLIDNLRIN